MTKTLILALALAVAALPLAAPAAVAMPDPGLPTPCDQDLAESPCTAWWGLMRSVQKVCNATSFGCPKAALPMLP